MAVVTWDEKVKVTTALGHKPFVKSNVGGVYYEDYNLPDGYWRYTWTNFTLNANPEYVEVYRMEME